MRETLTHRPPWRLALPFALLALIAGGLPTLLISNSIARVYAEGGWSTPVSLSIPIPPTFYTASPAVAINSLGARRQHGSMKTTSCSCKLLRGMPAVAGPPGRP